MVVLQGDEIQPPSEQLLLLSVSLIAVGLALFIVLHAYRGYRRNNSTRMLFLASGLCLITVVPLMLSIGITAFGYRIALPSRVSTFYLPLAIRISEIIGLCSLLYSLLVIPERSE